jgi:glutathione S-transferase
MIQVYQFQPFWGILNASPFCMKLEVYLQLANIPYQLHIINNPAKSPSGKLPFIKDGDKTITDTSVIIEYLKQTYGDELDQNLTAMQKAEAVAVQRMLEEHLYHALIYSRWVDDAGWVKVCPDFFGKLPKLAQLIVPGIVRRQTKKALWSQGLGRLSPTEIYAAGKKDIVALADFLYSQPYLLGDDVTSIDATVYAFVVNLLYTPIDSPLHECARQRPELTTYCERMKKRLYTNALTMDSKTI